MFFIVWLRRPAHEIWRDKQVISSYPDPVTRARRTIV
jgi:hypothetical protein